MINAVRLAVFWGLLAFLPVPFAFSQNNNHPEDDKTPVTDRQLAVMMFVDYGRSYG
jgi:hypothetical protein